MGLVLLLSGVLSLQISDGTSEEKRLWLAMRRIDGSLCKFAGSFGYWTQWANHVDKVRSFGETGRLAVIGMARSEEYNRGCALHYIHELGERRAVPTLRAIFDDSENDEGLRSHAFRLLNRFDATPPVDVLRTVALADDASVRLRFAVLDELLKIDRDEARDVLLILLERPSMERESAYFLVRHIATFGAEMCEQIEDEHLREYCLTRP